MEGCPTNRRPSVRPQGRCRQTVASTPYVVCQFRCANTHTLNSMGRNFKAGNLATDIHPSVPPTRLFPSRARDHSPSSCHAVVALAESYLPHSFIMLNSLPNLCDSVCPTPKNHVQRAFLKWLPTTATTPTITRPSIAPLARRYVLCAAQIKATFNLTGVCKDGRYYSLFEQCGDASIE